MTENNSLTTQLQNIKSVSRTAKSFSLIDLLSIGRSADCVTLINFLLYHYKATEAMTAAAFVDSVFVAAPCLTVFFFPYFAHVFQQGPIFPYTFYHSYIDSPDGFIHL